MSIETDDAVSVTEYVAWPKLTALTEFAACADTTGMQHTNARAFTARIRLMSRTTCPPRSQAQHTQRGTSNRPQATWNTARPQPFQSGSCARYRRNCSGRGPMVCRRAASVLAPERQLCRRQAQAVEERAHRSLQLKQVLRVLRVQRDHEGRRPAGELHRCEQHPRSL